MPCLESHGWYSVDSKLRAGARARFIRRVAAIPSVGYSETVQNPDWVPVGEERPLPPKRRQQILAYLLLEQFVLPERLLLASTSTPVRMAPAKGSKCQGVFRFEQIAFSLN